MKYNKYGRTEELYDVNLVKGVSINRMLSESTQKPNDPNESGINAIHQEVLQNLESIHGALLRMNQKYSIGGNFWCIKVG